MAMMDQDAYPTKAMIRKLRTWPVESYADCEALLDWLQPYWKWSSYFTRSPRRTRSWKGGRLERRYFVSTGGWSGHEEIMVALEKNRFFWVLAYYSHRRGGHYEFRV